jgi:predicted RNA-binding Zn ribbon-like protein
VTFKLVGGHLAVDFVNTVGGFEPSLEELLPSYSDLVAWAEQAGLLTREHAERLRAVAETEPHPAIAALRAARQLRAHLDAVLRAELASRAPEEGHLEAIREAYLAALARAHFTKHAPYGWQWSTSSADPHSVLWPLAHHIIDLLSSADLTRLKECSTSNCRWLYLDNTKNHNRRWCTADKCGANARMRRYRAAKRSATVRRSTPALSSSDAE